MKKSGRLPDVFDVMAARVKAYGGEKTLAKLPPKEKVQLADQLCSDIKSEPSYASVIQARLYAKAVGQPASLILQACALKVPFAHRSTQVLEYDVYAYGERVAARMNGLHALEFAKKINQKDPTANARLEPRETNMFRDAATDD